MTDFWSCSFFLSQCLNSSGGRHCFVPPEISSCNPGKASLCSKKMQIHSTGKKRCTGWRNECSGLIWPGGRLGAGDAPQLVPRECSLAHLHQQNKGEDSSSNLKPQHLSTYIFQLTYKKQTPATGFRFDSRKLDWHLVRKASSTFGQQICKWRHTVMSNVHRQVPQGERF